MASVTYAITTTAKVKALLNLTSTDAARDALIDTLVSAVTDFIEGFCGGRRFKSTDYVETYDTNNSDKVFLKQRPATAITTVEYRAGVPSNPTWMTYNADGYLKYLTEGYVKFFARFIPVPQAIRVTYTAGYLIDFTNELSATHTLPFDLTQVATELAATMFNRRYAGGIDREATEGQLIIWSSLLTDVQKSILKKYTLFHFAV